MATSRFDSVFQQKIETNSKADLERYGMNEVMGVRVDLEGTVNDHAFSMEGLGKGNIISGTQMIQIRVTRGGPLPFAFDIVSNAFQYGNRTFTSYPSEITDYFLQSWPGGFVVERSLRFEDGGIVNLRSDISAKDDQFQANVEFKGENFPLDGPVMQQAILGMEPSFETVYPRDGVVIGEVILAFKLRTAHHYTCHMKTIYRSKNPVKKLPKYHFIHHRLEKTNVLGEGSYIEQHETAIAQYPSIAKPFGSLYHWAK